jgi:hypothetical protein
MQPQQPTAVRQAPHPYCDDLISYLRVTFMNLSTLPASMREAAHFTCMTHVCDCMLQVQALIATTGNTFISTVSVGVALLILKHYWYHAVVHTITCVTAHSRVACTNISARYCITSLMCNHRNSGAIGPALHSSEHTRHTKSKQRCRCTASLWR